MGASLSVTKRNAEKMTFPITLFLPIVKILKSCQILHVTSVYPWSSVTLNMRGTGIFGV